MTNLDSLLKSRDITLPTKVHLVKAMVFLVVMYGCESWTIKKAEHRRIDAFELWCWRRLLRVPWTARRSNQSSLKSWVFTGGTDIEAETPIFWPPDAKSWLIGKDPDAGKDWGEEEKGTTEDEMVGWHHWLNGHGFGWIPGVGDGQGGLACCGSWGLRESDTTQWLNWTATEMLLFCSKIHIIYLQRILWPAFYSWFFPLSNCQVQENTSSPCTRRQFQFCFKLILCSLLRSGILFGLPSSYPTPSTMLRTQ